MSQVERHGWECFKQRESMENGTLEVPEVFQRGWDMVYRVGAGFNKTREDLGLRGIEG